MAFRGAKPKPTRLRLAHNSPGPLNVHEPQHAPLDEAVPEQLKDPLAREEWQRAIDITRGTGHIQAMDRAVLLAFCRKQAQLQRVEAEAEQHPFIVKGVNNGPMPNPALSLANRLTVIVSRLAAELGFTPSARSRVAALPTGTDVDDAFSRFQQQRLR